MTALLKRLIQTFLLAYLAGAALLVASAQGTPPSGITVEQALYAHQPGMTMPASGEAVRAWQAGRAPVRRVPMTGGTNWLVMHFENGSTETAWVFNPHGSLIEHVEARLYRQGEAPRTLITGYHAPREYMLHYGKDITLAPGERAVIVAQLRSPFYASQPRFNVMRRDEYRQVVSVENFLTLGALGSLLTLAVYNLFVFAGTRSRSFLYYSLYLFAYFLGWAFTFHVPAELLGLHDLRLHYIWFFLLPVLNTLFYLEFLQLRAHAPRLARISRVNLWLPLALLPTAVFALPYANLLASLVISLWLILALISGVSSWRAGFKPARFFVLGLIALLIPASVILPGNIGLTGDVPFNSELATLLGGTLDALLLAFALAELIRLLTQRNEQAIAQLRQTLHLARTDGLTGLGNRYAFDQLFSDAAAPYDLLILIDLDGLKLTNDRLGHQAGDRLLQSFAGHLARLEAQAGERSRTFRLGGDEFVILGRNEDREALQAALQATELSMRAGGFPDVGVSFGLSQFAAADSRPQSYEEADQRMYHHKQGKKRAQLKLLSTPFTPG